MTLNEHPPFDDAPLPELEQAGEPHKRRAVRQVVETVLLIESETEIQRPAHHALVFRGRLQVEPEEAYTELAAPLEVLGYTPLLQRQGQTDVVLVVEGVLVSPDADTGGGPMRRLMRWSGRSPWWLHLVLLVATIYTTMSAGTLLLQRDEALSLGDLIAAGGPFALTLLLILGVHEMGHYLAARYHKVKVTLPFFIPLPIPGSLGTLGAVIFIRSPLNNRKSLFDVGVSGPLAGLVVALPLFVIGLSLPPVDFGVPITLVFRRVGIPLLLDVIGGPLVEGSLGREILLHPVALAAWFGILLTAMNLLPLGQFDGGHVAYALLGRWAWPLAMGVFTALVFLGFWLWQPWLIWAFLATISGLRHPPPQNDITPLDWRRRLLGILTILIFLLIVVPQPIEVRQSTFGPIDPNATPFPTPVLPDYPTPTPYIFPP